MRREVSFRGALSGALRMDRFEGREHVVVPVVALVQGVIHASNAPAAELVLAEEFGKAPQAWNGRPVMLNHPSNSGHQVSANSPQVLERSAIGTIFGARVEGERLLLEAWIDPGKVGAVGGEAPRVLARLRRGETTEVSVGAFVLTEARSGVWNGVRYAGVWREIVPDHLAVLSEGTVGACSVEMGCGAPRAAEGNHMTTKEDDEVPEPPSMRELILAMRGMVEKKAIPVSEETCTENGVPDPPNMRERILAMRQLRGGGR
jgi:hypothetical protein